MIRSPIALRLNLTSAQELKTLLRQAALLGAKGVVLDAAGDLAPHKLGESARRELRHLLRTTELNLVALRLPTRRPFDRTDDLDDRLARADRAFELAFELGCRISLIHPGNLPPVDATDRIAQLRVALATLANRADHRGQRLALEIDDGPAGDFQSLISVLDEPRPAFSVDPVAVARRGDDPAAAVRTLGRQLIHVQVGSQTASVGGGRNFVRPKHMPGPVDWEELLGSLEEVDYRGYLTVWPASDDEMSATLRHYLEIFEAF
jgi:sugar phosphate isomerase/epimerase